MQPSRIYLARHGETDWNRARRWQGQTDVPLNAHGKAQAVDLGRALRGAGIRRIVTSNLSRARETGLIVAGELGVLLAGADARLRERAFGVFEGLTRDEVEARFPEAWRLYQEDRHNSPPRGELFENLIARVSQALVEQLVHPTTLVITHGGCMRSLWATFDPDGVRPLENGALMRLEASQHSGKLRIHDLELLGE